VNIDDNLSLKEIFQCDYRKGNPDQFGLKMERREYNFI
jgi:hypothetical protein